MQALPLLFVDIDGVISLWGWPPESPPDGAWTLVDGVGHFLSADAATRLSSLADAFELVWCSGWEERANDHLPHLVALGPLPHLSFDRPAPGGAARAHWKLAAIDAFAGPDRPVAWVDDALTTGCHAWASARPGPTRLITTRPAEGFTAAHAVALRTWAEGLGGR